MSYNRINCESQYYEWKQNSDKMARDTKMIMQKGERNWKKKKESG